MTSNLHRDPVDTLALLKGCGRATIQKLNANGLYTYQNLLDFEGSVPGINLGTLRKVAVHELKNTKEVSAHNWQDRVGHVIRERGQVTRAVVENLVIGPHRVLLTVAWQSRGKTKRKSISPIAMLCTQILWLSNDVISDDSDEDSCEPMETILPKFLVDVENPVIKSLNPHELRAIHSVVKETNQLYNCIYLKK